MYILYYIIYYIILYYTIIYIYIYIILSNHILSYNIWIKTMMSIIFFRFQHVFNHSQNFHARQHLGLSEKFRTWAKKTLGGQPTTT